MWKRVLASIGVGLSLSLILTSFVAVPASAATGAYLPNGDIFVENSDAHLLYNPTIEANGVFPHGTGYNNWTVNPSMPSLRQETTNLKFNCDDPDKLLSCDVSYKVNWDDRINLTRTYIMVAYFPNAVGGGSNWVVWRNLATPGSTVSFTMEDLNGNPIYDNGGPIWLTSYWISDGISMDDPDWLTKAFDVNMTIPTPPGYFPIPKYDSTDIPIWGPSGVVDSAANNGTWHLADMIFSYIPAGGVTYENFSSNNWRYKLDKNASDYFNGPNEPEPTPTPTPGPSFPTLPDPVIPDGPVYPDIPDFENGGTKEDPAETLGDCAVMDVQCYFEVLFVPKKNIIDEANGIVQDHKDRFPFNVIDEIVEMTNTLYDDEVACSAFTFDFGTFPGSEEPFIIEFTPCYPFIAQTSKSLTLYLGWAFCMVLFAAWIWRKIDMSFDA